MSILLKYNNFKNNIVYRLTFYILLLTTLVSMITQGGQIYFAYQNGIQQLTRRLEQVYSYYSLTTFQQPLDVKSLTVELNKVLHLTEVHYISLSPLQQLSLTVGKLPSQEFLLVKDFELHTSRVSSKLQVAVSCEAVYRQLMTRLIVSFIAQLLMLVVLAFILLKMLRRHVSQPIAAITHYVQHLDSATIMPLSAYEAMVEWQPSIHALKQWQEQCEQWQNQLSQTQHLLDVSPTGLALWHVDGAFLFVNSAFARILGRSMAEMLKLNYWNDIVQEQALTQEQAKVKALNLGERYGPLEKEFHHKDGYLVPIQLTALLIEKNGKFHLWSSVENLTRQKWVAKELQQALQKVEEANSAKSQFLASMSHELRTPMNAIMGYSEMLEEEIRECNRSFMIRDLKNIQAAAKLLLGLIDGILDISKIEAGKMQLYVETFDLATMIDNVVTTIQPLMDNKANTLKIVGEPPVGEVCMDVTKVRQILLNLLSHAAKFTEQGMITLEIQRYLQNDCPWLAIHIKDESIGMTPAQKENLENLFNRHEWVTQRHGGSELGLAITKRFTEMMGGTLEVNSEFGKGNYFKVHLPAQLNVPKTSLLSEEISINDDLKKPEMLAEAGVLLVIDDDESVRHLLEIYLSKVGYQVVLATSGQEGLKLAKQLRPNAITLDVMMPGMDGWEVLSALKADPELAHIPVIMLTMLDDQEIGYSLGAAEYLTKPISRHQLISILRKYRLPHAENTVMIVEDDSLTREMMVRMLHKVGWQVVEATNGAKALKILQQHKIDLILLDLMMPEMDGFEFIIHLRQMETYKTVPVAVLTAKDITMEDRNWLNTRVDSIFQKGAYTRNELLTQLRQLLAGAVTNRSHEQTLDG